MKVDLNAGESETFNLQGGRFYFQDGDDFIYVKLNSGGDTRTFKLLSGQGVNFEAGRFSSVEIINGSVPQSIEFEVYDRDVFDNRIPAVMDVEMVLPLLASGFDDESLEPSETFTIPANPNRKKLVVYTSPFNTGYVRSGPDASSVCGYFLPPNGSITFEGTFSVDVHNVDLSAQTFSYYEELKA